jgi:predicted NBD/HSP70 family sugar kinase
LTAAQLQTEESAASAQAVNCAAGLLDPEAVVLDGSFARKLQSVLIDETASALARYNWEGLSRPRLVTGSIGPDACALGGALLPLYANFSPNRELFLKL